MATIDWKQVSNQASQYQKNEANARKREADKEAALKLKAADADTKKELEQVVSGAQSWVKYWTDKETLYAIQYENSPTPVNAAILEAAHLKKVAYQEELDKAKKALSNFINKKSAIAEGQHFKDKSAAAKAEGQHFLSSFTSPSTKKAQAIKSPYKYNIPMVQSAYFSGGNELLSSTTDGPISSPGSHQKDAINSWGGNEATRWAKGAIQMDRKILANGVIPYKSSTGATSIKDTNAYGFRFLYNPSQVSMTWGTVDGVDWSYVEGASSNMATLLVPPGQGTTISFSLRLNRIEDFKYITPKGTIKEGMKNPYPVDAPVNDLKQIYNKGTMYDIEQLLRTLQVPGSMYKTILTGRPTGDPGWLPQMPVELFLGPSIRYRVRVNSISVVHGLFNQRMVPTMSEVHITCNRFFDFAVKGEDASKTSAIWSIPKTTK